MAKSFLAALIFGFVLLTGAGAALADPMAEMIGRWRDSDAESEIEIFRCGPALCGKIVWLKTPKQDSANPDPAMQARPLVGVQVLKDFTPGKKPAILAGEGYNPEDGKTYEATMTLSAKTTLVIKGCVMGGLLCEEDIWTRQP